MVDIHSVLADHKKKNLGNNQEEEQHSSEGLKPHKELIQIPDLFFDKIIVEYKLSRHDILVLMYIYRRVWCYPNLYQKHGLSPMMSHTEMSKVLGMNIEEVYFSLRKLEEFDFLKTLRAGQYFVRKYFTKEMDEFFDFTYDEFDF